MRSIADISFKKRRWGMFVLITWEDAPADAEPDEIDDETAVRAKIARGQRWSDEKWADVVAMSNARVARRRMVDWATGRLRTERQAVQYLAKLGVKGEPANEIIAWAKEQKLLDDARFAKASVSAAGRRGGIGPRKAETDLRIAGVDRQQARAATEPLRDPDTQLASAKALLEKHARRWEGQPRQTVLRRAFDLLARRGYESRIANQAMRAVLGAWDEE